MKIMNKLALVAILISTVAVSPADGIKWNTDLTKALAIAKKTHKPVMIDFYGEH